MSFFGILFTIVILIEVLDVPASHAVILVLLLSIFFSSDWSVVNIEQTDNDKILYQPINELQDNDNGNININDIKEHATREYIKNSRRLTESKLLIQKDDAVEVCDKQSLNCFTASEYIIHTGNDKLYACNNQNYCSPVISK